MIPDRAPDVVIRGFHMVQSRLERRELDLRAKTAELFRPEEFYLLDLPRSTIRGHNDKSFEVDGARAFYSGATDILFVESDARVQTPEDFVFRTTAVEFDTKTKLVRGEDDVQVFQQVRGSEKSLFDLRGKGLSIDITGGSYLILANAQAQKTLASGELMKITARQSNFDAPTNRLHFIDNVKVNAPKYKASGDRLILAFNETFKSGEKRLTKEAETDRTISRLEFQSKNESIAEMKDGTFFRARGLIFKLDDSGEDVEESHAIGSATADLPSGAKLKAEELRSITRDGVSVILLSKTVEIRVDNKIATCERGEYFPDKGDFILEEVASLNDGTQTINGERILYSLKDDSVTVERATGTLDRKEMTKKPKPAINE